MGRNRTGAGIGRNGYCVCPNCGTKVAHVQGQPCYKTKCPNCGATMTREGLQDTNPTNNTTSTSNKKIAHINVDKCIGCAKCVSACPFNAISIKNGKAVIDETKCKGCMVCQRVCPVQAIS
jgi:Pyruvate/2-oxoacid:ferredoxin oxidoreductase delta subunit